MTWTQISGLPPQIQKADGTLASAYYLKFYTAGTTTPISMATDSTGGTTLAKCKINASGYPISNDADETTVFIPHINATYKLVLYKNATDADNDTTASADWVIDNLKAFSIQSGEVVERVWLSGSDASGQVFTISEFTPASATLHVFQNGQGPLEEGASKDYTISGSQVTINSSRTINSGDRWLFMNLR